MQIENKQILIGGLLLIGGYLAYKEFGNKGNKNVVGSDKGTYKTDEFGMPRVSVNQVANNNELPEYVKVRMNMAKEMIDHQLSLGKTQAEAEAYAMAEMYRISEGRI